MHVLGWVNPDLDALSVSQSPSPRGQALFAHYLLSAFSYILCFCWIAMQVSASSCSLGMTVVILMFLGPDADRDLVALD